MPPILSLVFPTGLPPQLATLPAYRLKQIARWVFHDLIDDWNKALNLPESVRSGLADIWPLTCPAAWSATRDSRTAKALVTLADRVQIETVLMRYPKRNAVCVSTQAGCAVGCSFCATGRMGFRRNLTAWEIVIQALICARRLRAEQGNITNVVLMGMGEPFLNYDATLAAIRILNHPEGMHLGQRRLSVSTSGIVPGIRRFTREDLEVNLAISLHAPTDELRSRLMRINDRYPLTRLIPAVSDYARQTRRRVMFEYILIDGVNDTDACADALAQLLDQPLFFINVIPYNPTGVYRASGRPRLLHFIARLRRAGRSVTQRFEFGQDIHAACGQLATAGSASWTPLHPNHTHHAPSTIR